ncbi:MAG: PQQ-binding-like beta-propeller repeat protein [bacterium]
MKMKKIGLKISFFILIVTLMFGMAFSVTGAETEKTESKPDETIVWGKTFGGKHIDKSYSISQTSDGGYIVAGETFSSGSGKADAYVIKLDSKGKKVWEETFGGKEIDNASCIQQTSDGGYIIAGSTQSFGAGKADAYVIKLDNKGEKVWEKTFGGKELDSAQSIQEISKGGYILAGTTYSLRSGKGDAYIVKLDEKGNKVWEKTFKGNDTARAHSVKQVSDGGYIFAGTTYSFTSGGGEAYIVRLDSKGNKVWEKMFGEKGRGLANDIKQVSDGGYIVAGQTASGEPDKTAAYIIKLDNKGNKEWDKKFETKDLDAESFVSGKELKGANANSIIQTSDGGYIVAIYIYSKTRIEDAYIIKLDGKGNDIWKKTIGLKQLDKEYAEIFRESASINAYSINQTADKGFIVGGEITDTSKGISDIYIIKTDPNGVVY